MFSQRNISYVLVGKNVSETSATRSESLLSGEIGISNVHGTILTSGTGVTQFMIHQGGSNRTTGVIKVADIVSINAKAYAAAAEQVDFIGYNGTSGAIVAANSNDYFIRLNMPFGSRGQEFPQQNWIMAYYKSDASATQNEIADELAFLLNADARKRYERDIRAEVICDHAGAAITGAPTSYTFVKDSKTVSYAGTDASNVAVGDYLRVGGTTTASPIYKVAAINTSTNVVTLDKPYAGDNATILVANIEVITAAQAAAANCGIKLSGIARKFDLIRNIRYRKVRWITSLSGFGTTPIDTGGLVNSVVPKLGSGTYEQVAEEDLFGDIVFGNKYRGDVKFPRNLYAEAGGTYGCVTITWEEKGSPVIGAQPVTRKVARVFFNNQASTNATGFITTLGEAMNTTYTFS